MDIHLPVIVARPQNAVRGRAAFNVADFHSGQGSAALVLSSWQRTLLVVCAVRSALSCCDTNRCMATQRGIASRVATLTFEMSSWCLRLPHHHSYSHFLTRVDVVLRSSST